MSFKLNHMPIAGESYRRCNQVVIDNPLSGPPSISFGQETIIGTGSGQVAHIPLQPINMDFDANNVITIINPETGEPTGGTIAIAEVYALIYSAYIATATPAPEQAAEEPI